jgi:putative endonuclease
MQWRSKDPAVYFLASRPNGTLYVGVTSALYDRMIQHKEGTFDGFTRKYGVKTLVYCEFHPTMEQAILRETQIKKWRRQWKIRLIEQVNPTWRDLFDSERGVDSVAIGGQSEVQSHLLGWPPPRP